MQVLDHMSLERSLLLQAASGKRDACEPKQLQMLRAPEREILKLLAKNRGQLLSQKEIQRTTGQPRITLQRALNELERHALVYRPRGPRSGYAATAAGIQWVQDGGASLQ
jgi:uncharacterized membrane protein